MNPTDQDQRLYRALLSAERSVRLLDRCSAVNHQEEVERLTVAFQRGQPNTLRARYPSVENLAGLLEALTELDQYARRLGPLGEMIGERIRELMLEGQLATAIGQPKFVELARERYRTRFASRQAEAHALAEHWCRETPETNRGATVPFSDDRLNPESLLRQIERLLTRHGLPWQLQVDASMAALASVGDGVIRIRDSVRVTPALARSLALHEVEGHALVRVNAARQPLLVARLGSCGGLDHQEGRALALERRAGHLPPERRRALGSRHLAAACCLDGGTFIDAVQELMSRGMTAAEAVPTCVRVFRGGGLAREFIYLPAYLGHLELLEQDPEAEDWLAHAALSWDATRRLRELGFEPVRQP